MKEMKETTLSLAEALDPSKSGNLLIPFDSRLIEQAMREGVAGILYKSLLASGRLESLDQIHRETLQAYYYQTIRFNLQLIYSLKEVLHLASQMGLGIVLLQGVDLLHGVYDDLGLRPMMDIDLWVTKNEYDGLVRVLTSLGYDRDPVYPNTYKRRSIIFDIHTHILWADRVGAFRMLLVNDETLLRHDLRFVDIEGEKALCLSPCDQVLYLTLHAIKHWINRLIWLVDIKKIVEPWGGKEWELLLQRSNDLGQEKTVAYMLFLLRSVLHVNFPPWPERFQRRRLNALEKWILRQRSKRGSLPRWAPVFLFSSELGAVNRFRFLLENLFPRIEVLRQVFPTPPDLRPWQLYGRRALQLIGMLLRALKGS